MEGAKKTLDTVVKVNKPKIEFVFPKGKERHRRTQAEKDYGKRLIEGAKKINPKTFVSFSTDPESLPLIKVTLRQFSYDNNGNEDEDWHANFDAMFDTSCNLSIICEDLLPPGFDYKHDRLFECKSQNSGV